MTADSEIAFSLPSAWKKNQITIISSKIGIFSTVNYFFNKLYILPSKVTLAHFRYQSKEPINL